MHAYTADSVEITSGLYLEMRLSGQIDRLNYRKDYVQAVSGLAEPLDEDRSYSATVQKGLLGRELKQAWLVRIKASEGRITSRLPFHDHETWFKNRSAGLKIDYVIN